MLRRDGDCLTADECDRLARGWMPVFERLKARYGDAEVGRRWDNFLRMVPDAAELPALIFEAGWRHWR
jgi:hypothetical protein